MTNDMLVGAIKVQYKDPVGEHKEIVEEIK